MINLANQFNSFRKDSISLTLANRVETCSRAIAIFVSYVGLSIRCVQSEATDPIVDIQFDLTHPIFGLESLSIDPLEFAFKFRRGDRTELVDFQTFSEHS